MFLFNLVHLLISICSETHVIQNKIRIWRPHLKGTELNKHVKELDARSALWHDRDYHSF